MIGKTFVRMLPMLVVSVLIGCAEISRAMKSTWHEKCGWKAEEFFDDPQVISLCKAIEANNLDKIDRLVAAGADVNAQGKGKMTPLLWAFPDNNLERFKRLLEHGADPNVVIESDFNTRGGMSPGDSVTHMACNTAFAGYFEAVFEHGGNPNIINTSIVRSKDTPVFTLLTGRAPQKMAKIQQLIELGADLNHLNGIGVTPPMQAASRGAYDIALMLLKAGADHRAYQENELMRLIHILARQENRLVNYTPQQQEDYSVLIKWLEDRGELLEEAKADMERWRSWNNASGESRRKMDAEIAARKAREAREKAAAKENKANRDDE